MSRGQIGLYSTPTHIADLSHNILYGLNVIDNFTFAKTLHTENADASNITAADHNYYFNPYRPDNISIGFNLHTLAEWQAVSSLDTNSTTNWFNLNVGDPPLSRIFYNDTVSPRQIDLGNRLYLELDQNTVTGSFTLAPFTSRILIDSGEVALSPTLLIFGDASSPPQPITLYNVTNTPLTISDITVTTHFNQTHNCPTTMSPNTSCTISVSYTPTTSGSHSWHTNRQP